MHTTDRTAMRQELNSSGTAVAVVGMAGRFPGAQHIDELWENLCTGVESIQARPAPPSAPGGHGARQFVPAVAMLDDYESFDAAFFGISPGEAALTDPQQRIFLECCWAALEHAGYDPGRPAGVVGVFGGAGTNTYLLLNLASQPELLAAHDLAQINLGNANDFLTTRVSYKLNLRGPSHVVQCACSTSLVAVHIACQSLLNRESDMALAGGVAVNVAQRDGYWYVEGGMAAPDGHCRAFDAQAGGTVFGSGVGVVVLKRLSDALRDGDTVHAVIKGSAINNDGALKVGYTAPSIEGQAQVIQEALAYAGVSADTIGYVEAHGTGTALGDPIEVAALTRAFRATTARSGFCALGTLKPNIGHLDAAAGVAGLLKAVLMLKHGLIPPSLHYTQPNPQIDFAHSPFVVNTALAPWPTSDQPRRAGVSSFGFGGTNAHLVLEEPPPQASAPSQQPWHVLALSARTPAALAQQAVNLAAHLERHPSLTLADVAYTLAAGRAQWPYRQALRCRDRDEALAALGGGTAPVEPLPTGERPVLLLFPASDAAGLAAIGSIAAHAPTARHAFEQCAAACPAPIGAALRGLWDGPPVAVAPWLAELALYTLQYGLAQCWLAWGLQPHALAGLGAGGYAAAWLAGALPFDGALRLLWERAQLAQHAPPGDPTLVTLLTDAALAAGLRQANLRPSRAPLMLGPAGWLGASEATDPHRWHTALTAPPDGAASDPLAAHPHAVVIEIGGQLVWRNADARQSEAATDWQPGGAGMLAGAARLWELGVRINLAHGYAEARRRVPLPTYPFERQRYWIDARPPHSDGAPPAAPVLHPRPALAVPYAAPAGELEQRLATIWQQALGITRIGARDSFFDLGGDSLIALRIAEQVKQQLGVELPAASLYEGLTIRALAALIAQHGHGEDIDDQDDDQRTSTARLRRQHQLQRRQRRAQATDEEPTRS